MSSIENLLNEIPSTTNNSYLSVLFSSACLYAVVVFLYSLLALNSTAFQQRQQRFKEFYNHHSLAVQQHQIQQKQRAEKNSFQRTADFLHAFFMRPSVLAGLLFAVMVVRNYREPIVSMMLAYGVSGLLAYQFKSYETKFIPGMVIAIGIAYGAAHHLGWQNGWHSQVGI